MPGYKKKSPHKHTLDLDSAPEAAERYIQSIPPYTGRYRGRGIVTCAGSVKYNTCAWVMIRMLRHLGCTLPIEVWYLGDRERDEKWIEMVSPYGVDCVDATRIQERFPHPRLGGWELKPYAMLHTPFREVLFLDADNVPVIDPTYLFEDPAYQDTGAILWPDGFRTPRKSNRWQAFDVEYRNEREVESGQILVNKETCWRSMNLCNWYNEHSDYFYRIVYGDKDTFRYAWHRLKQVYAMPKKSAQVIPFTLCQHDMQGRRVFQHRCGSKWSLGYNRRVAGFKYQKECLGYLNELQQEWNPHAHILHNLSPEDRRLMNELTGGQFTFYQLGHGRWTIELGADGLISRGRRQCEWFWSVEEGELIIRGADGVTSCRLKLREDNTWQGPHLQQDRQIMRLVPLPNVEPAA